jgi:acyl dehydratase
MTQFENPAQLAATLGKPLGYSGWLVISQDMINRFADLTGDRQWIHVDIERAKREAPGGTTIAHGYLMLALLGVLQPQIYSVTCRSTLNYGLNKMRFLSPVPAGARVRLTETIKDAQQIPAGWRIAAEATLEVEGATKPAYVAEIVFQYYD